MKDSHSDAEKKVMTGCYLSTLYFAQHGNDKRGSAIARELFQSALESFVDANDDCERSRIEKRISNIKLFLSDWTQAVWIPTVI